MDRLGPMDQQTGYLILLFKAAFAAALIVMAIIASDLAVGATRIAIISSMIFLVAAYMVYARSRPPHVRDQNRLDVKRLWQGPFWGHAILGIIVYGIPMIWIGNRQSIAQGQFPPNEVLAAGLLSGTIFGIAIGWFLRKVGKR